MRNMVEEAAPSRAAHHLPASGGGTKQLAFPHARQSAPAALPAPKADP